VKEEDVNPVDELEESQRDTEEDNLDAAKERGQVQAWEMLRLDGDVPIERGVGAGGNVWVFAGLVVMALNLAVG
jgi:hypothetical protein